MDERAWEPLAAADVARLVRWHAAGRPPVPLVVDTVAVELATIARLITILTTRTPTWEPVAAMARCWIDRHCPAWPGFDRDDGARLGQCSVQVMRDSPVG